jgi:hypothetical protein
MMSSDDIKSGSDLRLWRSSLGLYVHEVAALLHVTPITLRRAEASAQISPRILDGVQLIRTKLLLGSLQLQEVRKTRSRRGRPRKSADNGVN